MDDRTISCYRGEMTTPNKTAAATAARRRIGLETMAAKLRAAGFDVLAPPECPHGCVGYLDWREDMYHCRVCGDEWAPETVRGSKR